MQKLNVRAQLSRASKLLFKFGMLCLAAITSAHGLAEDPELLPFAGKVLVGYQGWFRCPGDGAPGNRWSHWSGGIPAATTLQIDLYPDTSELPAGSRCALPAMDIHGSQAYVFSSFPKTTVEKHFEWMQAYGIDGVLLQRFFGEINPLRKEGDVILQNVQASAESHHRVFGIEYDLTGYDPATALDVLQADWKYLTETRRITASRAYLKQDGLPVVSLWGLGFSGEHANDPVLALRIIRWFKDTAHVKVMGGVPAGWGTLSSDSVSDKRWAAVYAQLDIIQPWTVGRYGSLAQADEWKNTHLRPDMDLTKKNGQIYMPVIFPGFSWHNLNRTSPQNQIPRLGGRFLWQQAYNARAAGATILKIAMFDEVNEGTAIFKAESRRDQAPAQGYWLTLDADGERLPSDWYLRLAGEITRGFRGTQTLPPAIPIRPYAPPEN